MFWIIRLLNILVMWQTHASSWSISSTLLFACALQEHLRYLSFDAYQIQLA